jgi:PAS domain S-box-containing protein
MTVIAQDTYREIFDHAPAGMAQVSLEGDWLAVNRRLCEITGYSSDELLATNWQAITHPGDVHYCLDLVGKFVADNLQSRSYEKRYIRKDGSIVWVKVSISLVRDVTNQAPLYFAEVIDDITEYKRAQEQRATAEEKWSKAFRQSPMAIAIFDIKEHRFLEVNDAFEAVTGLNRHEAMGRRADELDFLVDRSALQEMIDAVVAGNRVWGLEREYRTRDGKIGSALFFGDRIEIDGEPCILGAALGITDRKRLETELQELSGSLIKAQDEERRRISAELTDSLGQSVTVISFEASQLARNAQELGPDLNSLSAKIRDVSTGIEIISQSLHPTGLDYTGLPWAIEGLCRQFTHLYGLQIAFKHEGVPSSLAGDLALCLYRIVQEGLNNVVRHSGRRQAWIELESDGSNVIGLNLWDNGVGFNVDSVKAGLGLLTMRERCRRMNGWLAIHNENGTRIEVQIPLVNVEGDLFC